MKFANRETTQLILPTHTHSNLFTTVTTYSGGYIYEEKTFSGTSAPPNVPMALQFFGHEEGRVRLKKDANGTFLSYVYDYFLKDHLGNVRSMVTEEAHAPAMYPTASMEDVADKNNLSDPNNYIPYYSNTDYTVTSSFRSAKPVNYPDQSASNQYVSKTNGNGQKIGPSILIKVMAGDKVDFTAQSFHRYTGSNPTNSDPVPAIKTLLSGLLAGTGGGKGTAEQIADGNAPLTTSLSNFLAGRNANYVNGGPKAYVQAVLLNDQFKYEDAPSNRWFQQVGAADVLTSHTGSIDVQKNGYLYIYTSNEYEGVDVFFDNLAVTHEKGQVLEETHYYPFGLTMAGISSKAANSVANKYKFGGKELNSNEFSDGSGLELYDFSARNYDPQLGRFWGGDRKADKLFSWSPYTYCLNNLLVFVDPDGEYPIYIVTRSYAPFPTFGPGNKWHGDNRGATLNHNASYRTRVAINHDTETKQTSAHGGRSRSYTTDGKKDAYSNTNVKDRSKGDNIDVHSYGNNGAQTGSWDIDQFTKLTATIEGNVKGDHILNVSGTISGDDFPNGESMMYDSKGNTLWLGNSETQGDRQSGPVTDLPLENEGDVQINVGVRVKVNKDGVFQGVMTKDKDGKETMISISDWNKRFKSDDNKK